MDLRTTNALGQGHFPQPSEGSPSRLSSTIERLIGNILGDQGRQPSLVSVIVPTYYRNDRLRDSLESVAAQTYPAIEVIVVDGSGEAFAESVVESFDDLPITYIAQERDEGPQAARSLGAERSAGDYVQFLDDDDRLHPEKLSKQVAYLEENPAAGVVYCGLKREFGDYRMPYSGVEGNVLYPALSLRMGACYTTAMLIRRSVLEQILPLKNRHGADDMGMKIELAQLTEFGYVDEPLLTMGEQEYNLGSSGHAIKGRLEILDRYSDLYEQAPTARGNALANTYAATARLLIAEDRWSPLVPFLFTKAATTSGEFAPKYVFEAVFSLGGRSFYEVGARSWRLLMKYVPSVGPRAFR